MWLRWKWEADMKKQAYKYTLKPSRGILGSLTVLLALRCISAQAFGSSGSGVVPVASQPSSGSASGRKKLLMPVGLLLNR